MISLWPATIASLNDSLAVLYEMLGSLKAAKSVDLAEVIEQLKTAAESSRNLRDLVLSEMPEASWQNQEELDALLEEIQESAETRALEQQRYRLWLWRLSWNAGVSCTMGIASISTESAS